MPKLSGEIQWNTGPMSSPMMMRNNTSGIRFRLNISLKRWAVKIKSPMMAMVNPISLDELLVVTCSKTFPIVFCCAMVSGKSATVSLIRDSVLVVRMRSV